jgi:hypothetical protein
MTTVYFAGSEDSAFSSITSFGSTTSTTFYRSAFARAGVSQNNFTGSAFPPAASALTPQFGPVSSFWVHGQHNETSGTGNNNCLLAAYDSGGVGRILVLGTATSGQVKICTRNAAGTITTLVTSAAGTIPASTLVPLDLFVNYGTSGQCQLWVNGVNVADTGTSVNVTTDSATALAQVAFASLSTSCGWSECIVQDTSTLGLGLLTLPTVAAGNTQSWTPNTVADVNPTAINDSNFVAATAASSLSEWTVSMTLPSGTWTIEAVVQTARVSVGATGPQHFEWLVRTSDGSDHVTGSVAPTTSFANYSNIWMTNPHTSAAWGTGELVNAGIESLT